MKVTSIIIIYRCYLFIKENVKTMIISEAAVILNTSWIYGDINELFVLDVKIVS